MKNYDHPCSDFNNGKNVAFGLTNQGEGVRWFHFAFISVL